MKVIVIIAVIAAIMNVGGVSAETLELRQGWNFISFSRIPSPASIETVLNDISQNIRIVWGYDNQTKNWAKYKPFSKNNTLTSIEFGKGYWIYMDVKGIIDLSEFQSTASDDSLPLYKGWNLIGWKGDGGTNALEALAPLGNQCSVVWTWDTGQWQAIANPDINIELTAVPEFSRFFRERAYWIKIAEDTVFIPPTISPSGTPSATITAPKAISSSAASGKQISWPWDGVVWQSDSDGIPITWTAQNVLGCFKEGDWSGDINLIGSGEFSISSGPGVYRFGINCQGPDGTIQAFADVEIVDLAPDEEKFILMRNAFRIDGYKPGFKNKIHSSRWIKPQVKVYFPPPSGLILQEALDEWNIYLNPNGVSLVVADTSVDADILISFSDLSDSYCGPVAGLAATYFDYSSFFIKSAEIKIDPLCSDTCLWSVLVHELGHTIGILAHIQDGGVMWYGGEPLDPDLVQVWDVGVFTEPVVKTITGLYRIPTGTYFGRDTLYLAP